MLDEAIQKFLSEQKADWLKKNITANTSEEAKLIFNDEANNRFSLEIWLPIAAKKAGQLSFASHPCKFTHPSSKTNSIIAKNIRSDDGLLRTGNAYAELDVFGNAASIVYFKFLSLKLNDGKTILDHLELQTDKIKENFRINSASFEELRNNFLAIKKNEEEIITSGKIKQVYFPVGDNYHLLSVLTPSGLMFELKNRIQTLRFSEEAKSARDDKRKQVYNEIGFDELYQLTIIGYGGTKSQNISILNSTNRGKAYLLSSLPPLLSKQRHHLPTNNFFSNYLWPKHFEDEFNALHKLFKSDYNNRNIREGRDWWIQTIIDRVIEKMWVIRMQDITWSAADIFEGLPLHQKIWLDESRKNEREANDEWLDKVVSEFARWFKSAYEKVVGRLAIKLMDDELLHIKKIIVENLEGLR
jgi:CRISPR-associated protein Csy1